MRGPTGQLAGAFFFRPYAGKARLESGMLFFSHFMVTLQIVKATLPVNVNLIARSYANVHCLFRTVFSGLVVLKD